ncbi:MAG: hypothetical protein ACO3VF_07850 [Tamlana sp.]
MTLIQKIISKKNEIGDIVEMNCTTCKISDSIIFKWSYKYDNLGNWIKKTRITENKQDKEILSVSKRSIEYKN